MKILFENKLTESYVEMFEDALDSVPDIDVKMIDWFFEHPAQMEDFVSSKLQHLYDDEDLDEAVVNGKEVDLVNKDKTIANALTNDEIKEQINEILVKAEMREIPFVQARSKIIELFNNLENVNDSQKRKAMVALSNAKAIHHLESIITTYILGDKLVGKRYNSYH